MQKWVDQMAAMCQPARVYWCDGSEKEKQRLTAQAVRRGELTELNQRKMPGCVLHRTAPNDVARTEHLTFICTSFQADAGPTNNLMSPRVAYRKGRELFAGAIKGRTVYVVPFSMGPIGSPFSKIGIELTEQHLYGAEHADHGAHGRSGARRPGAERRIHQVPAQPGRLGRQRPADHAFPRGQCHLVGGQRLRRERPAGQEMPGAADRLGVGPAREMVRGAHADSGDRRTQGSHPVHCGRVPQRLRQDQPGDAPAAPGLKKKGYRIWSVGDDIAWMRVDTDGRLWAINPEMGFFGVVPGTNSQTNRNALATIRRDSILTNVGLPPEGTAWWEGHDDPPPARDIDMTGLRLPRSAMRELLAVDRDRWLAELESVHEFLDQFGTRLPGAIWAQHAALRRRLQAPARSRRTVRR